MGYTDYDVLMCQRQRKREQTLKLDHSFAGSRRCAEESQNAGKVQSNRLPPALTLRNATLPHPHTPLATQNFTKVLLRSSAVPKGAFGPVKTSVEHQRLASMDKKSLVSQDFVAPEEEEAVAMPSPPRSFTGALKALQARVVCQKPHCRNLKAREDGPFGPKKALPKHRCTPEGVVPEKALPVKSRFHVGRKKALR